jgi:uncharacterized protein YbaR (Trm112 family)
MGLATNGIRESGDTNMAGVDEDLLGIMACPFCRSALKLDGGKICCVNAECGCRYSIVDEIPVMLIDEAERPCPKCGQQRDWNEDDVLSCPGCGTRIAVPREPPLRAAREGAGA